jgi:hypothetical protein
MIYHLESGRTRDWYESTLIATSLPEHVVCIRGNPKTERIVKQVAARRTFVSWGECEDYYKKNYKGVERLKRAVEYAWVFKLQNTRIASRPLVSLMRWEGQDTWRKIENSESTCTDCSTV